jgi:hypothetical protein
MTRRWLTVAVLVGPIAWAVDLLGSYVLLPNVAGSGAKLGLFVVTALTLVVAAAGALVAWRVFRQTPTGEVGWRFVGAFGIGLDAFFVLVIVANAVPKLLLHTGD